MMTSGCSWNWDSASSLAAWWPGLLEASLPCLLSLHVFRSSPFKVLSLEFARSHATTVFLRFFGELPIWGAVGKGSNYFSFRSCHLGPYAVSIGLWQADANREPRTDQVMHVPWLPQLSTN